MQDYEKQTGIPLANHPLAEKLQICQSVESVTTLLQDQALAFGEFRGSDKIMNTLKSVVSALSRVAATGPLGHGISMVCSRLLIRCYMFRRLFDSLFRLHMQYILASVSCSLYVPLLLLHAYPCNTHVSQAFKGMSVDLDALVDLLESIEHFLKRLDIYTKVPPTPAMTEIVMKIMVELVSSLALATKQIRLGRPSESIFADVLPNLHYAEKFVKKLFGENEVEAVLQRLDRLTQDEARTTAAQTLEVVYGLVRNMRVLIDGKRIYLVCHLLAVEQYFFKTARHRLTASGKPLVRFIVNNELVLYLTLRFYYRGHTADSKRNEQIETSDIY